MFIYANPNPRKNYTGDCVVRALSIALDKPWDDIFLDLMKEAFIMKDMPSSNVVWGYYLHKNGFRRYNIPDICPGCITIRDITENLNKGVYILGTGTHVVAVIDGNYYDTGDSGNEIPIYYWKR